jgi:Kef-type K+ transport system membrane component KefB
MADKGKRRTNGRMVGFYVIMAAIVAAVVIVVFNAGAGEKALPSIAGGYTAAGPASCLGPVPKPAGGVPLPATAPAKAPVLGPSFNLLQSGQFVNFTNNQGTLGGKLRLDYNKLPGGGHKLTGSVSCVNGGSEQLTAVSVPGASPTFAGTLGGLPISATLKSAPPTPGTANPRTPSGIGGMYTVSPRSTCLGGGFNLNGSGSGYELVANSVKLGHVSYSTKTAAVFGDVACVKGGTARLTATANDLTLQDVTVIPLQVATPVHTAVAKPGAKPVLSTPSGLSPAGEVFTATKQRLDFNHLVAIFFVSIAIVLVVARLFGIVAVRVGQPRVMGEVIAGLALGPSVLGAISANLQATLFPTDILSGIGIAANLGLIFYMFLIGMEVDRDQLKGKVSRAAAISNTSVALPMVLGIAVALPLYKLLGPNKKFAAFALYVGVAMSITAFPVLARILAERRMIKRPVGALAVACAAIDDVTAWFLIALATAIAASGSLGGVAKTIGEAIAFTLIMWLVVRRVLARMGTAFDEVGRIPTGWFAAIVILVLVCAWITQEINIAFIFGAFMAGMVMPRHARLTEEVTRRIEDFVVTLLLPLFFVYTGLKTNVTLLDRPELWLITLLLIAVAIVGKLAGAAIAARVSGVGWKESAVIGTLMNTRGLTELIALNLALSAGAISNSLFAALVVMAVVTTLMAGPLLKLIDPRNEYGSNVDDELEKAKRDAAEEFPQLRVPDRSILVAPQSDNAIPQLIALAEPLAKSRPQREIIIARPVRPPRGAGAGVRGGLQSIDLQLEDTTEVLDRERRRLAQDAVASRGLAFSSVNLSDDLLDVIDREPVDLLLIEGRRRLIGEGVPLGDVGRLLEKAACDAGVLVAREEDPIEVGPDHPILVPFGGAEHDWAALELGSWLAASTGAPLRMMGAAGATDERTSVTRLLADAGLLVQQATGIESEPLVVAGGRDGIVEAAAGAGLLVIGLSDRWRREGLGPTRSEIAKAAPAPVLFVKRGARPGLIAPKESVTQFNWSMAGGPTGMIGGLVVDRDKPAESTSSEGDTPPLSV